MLKNKIIKNIPNALTISRIIASVLGAGAFVLGNIGVATGLYIYGAVSDMFDGMAARKLNAFSELGRKLDALSDKLYAGSLLIPSILCGNLLMLIPLLLELRISYINLKGQKLGIKTETHRIGKIKTVALFPTMIVGLLSTIDPAYLMILWPMMIVTTNLQYNSIVTYNNVLIQKLEEKNNRVEIVVKEKVNDDVAKEKNDKTKNFNYKYIWDKGKNLLDECAYYTMYQVPSISKSKKLKKIR